MNALSDAIRDLDAFVDSDGIHLVTVLCAITAGNHNTAVCQARVGQTISSGILKPSIVWTSREILGQISRNDSDRILYLCNKIIGGIGVPFMDLSGAVPVDGGDTTTRSFKLGLEDGIIVGRGHEVVVVEGGALKLVALGKSPSQTVSKDEFTRPVKRILLLFIFHLAVELAIRRHGGSCASLRHSIINPKAATAGGNSFSTPNGCFHSVRKNEITKYRSSNINSEF